MSENIPLDDLGSEYGSCPAPAPPSSPTRAPALHSAKQNREKITCTQGPSRVRARVRGTASGRDREVGNDWFDPIYEHLFTGSQLVASSKQQHLKTPVLARPDRPPLPWGVFCFICLLLFQLFLIILFCFVCSADFDYREVLFTFGIKIMIFWL